MKPLLHQHLEACGRITTAEAGRLGVGRHALSRLVRDGSLHRVHRGTYVAADRWRAATPSERHLMRCRAVLANHRHVALSHTSALVAHGLPLYGVDLSTVHLSRIGTSGRCGRQAGTVVHPVLEHEAVTAADGLIACHPAIAVLQVADWHGLPAGMVAAEGGLHRKVFTGPELQRALGQARLGRGRRDARLVVSLAGPLSESPGETLTKLLLRAIGLPPPDQQVRVDLPGEGTARVDFMFPQWGVIVEFDGASKYGGERGRDELVREKRREDLLRSLGYEIVRLMWTDLTDPAGVRSRIIDARRRAARSRTVGSAPRW